MVFDRDGSTHGADDETVFRYAKLLSQRRAQLRPWAEPFGIHAVVNYADSIGRKPGLLGVIVAKLARHSENGVGHRVRSAPKNAAAPRQAVQHIQFVAVLTVDGDGNAREARSRNRFNRAPISRMHDVRAISPHDTGKTQNHNFKPTVGFSFEQ